MAWLYALYLRGEESDAERGAFLKQAAEQGIVPAMHDYAEFLEDELYQPEEADPWYAAAAEAGYAPSIALADLWGCQPLGRGSV